MTQQVNPPEDPKRALHLPSFVHEPPPGDAPPSGEDASSSTSPAPFSPPPLDAGDWERLHSALEEKMARRKAYRGRMLRVMLDGAERLRFNLAQTPRGAFNITDHDTSIEVFGRDESGDLLLAVFPIEFDTLQWPREFYVTQDGGQRISLRLSRLEGDDGTVPKGLVELTYTETHPIRAAVLLWERWQLLWAPWRPVPRLAADALTQLLAALGSAVGGALQGTWSAMGRGWDWLHAATEQPVPALYAIVKRGAPVGAVILLVGALLFGYDRVVRQPAHHALRRTVQTASDATIAAVHQMQEDLDARWREATQRVTLQAAAQAREEAATAAEQLRTAMADGFREVAQRLEHRIQHDLRAEVRATIHDGFREAGRLRLLLAHAQPREATVTVARQVRVLTVAANGTTFPYPTFGQEPPNVLAIGEGLRQFPALQTEYHDYLAQWPDIFRQLGESLVVAGNLDGAIQVLDYLRHVPPYDRDKSLLFLLAESYKMRGDHREAIAVYDDMIQRGLADRDARVYHYIGWSHFELHDYDRALAYYDEALRLSPRYSKVFYNRALAYQAKSGLSAAERARLVDDNLQRALDLTLEAYAHAGDTPRILFTLSLLYTAKQEPALALQYLARVLQQSRAYVVRLDYERAFAFFRDPAQEPYHTEFVALLERYRPRAQGSSAESAEEPFDPTIFWE